MGRLIAAAALLLHGAALATEASIGANAAPAAALAPGEVLLEIEATGSAKSRPDAARLFVIAKSEGETTARARSLNEALVARIGGAARQAGVAPADIRLGTNPWSRMAFVGNEAIDAGVAALSRPTEKTEFASFEIRVRDVSRVDPIRSALEEAGADQVVGPFFALENDSAARRAARADAVRQARAEAEDYANALGMRVARILRVSERVSPYVSADASEAVLNAMYAVRGPTAQEIETRADLAVDFAIVPR
ncbi:MAG TPA: SIMPL domain-containing protein [Allosphingosinicella sp.]|nr:SIMPL domain-containing protein [Allosphingosinicella sp.]